MLAVRCRASPPALLLFLTFLASSPAAPQTLADHEEDWASGGAGELAFLSINAVIGGLTAGLWQELSEGSFAEGFTGGALGGSVVYAGKRLTAESFPGAGFLGRQVASVGSSIVRNTADARPLLDSLRLPLGPVRVYLGTRDRSAPRFEVALPDLYWTIYGLAESRLSLDPGESLSSGTPVFRSDRPIRDADDDPILGTTTGGVIFVSPLSGQRRERTLAHERAHVLQMDFFYQAWFRPLEDNLAGRLPGSGFIDRVDYDVTLSALLWGGSVLGWSRPFHAPIEAEAEFLESR